MPFAAFDLHKKEVEAVILSDLGEATHRERFPTMHSVNLSIQYASSQSMSRRQAAGSGVKRWGDLADWGWPCRSPIPVHPLYYPKTHGPKWNNVASRVSERFGFDRVARNRV